MSKRLRKQAKWDRKSQVTASYVLFNYNSEVVHSALGARGGILYKGVLYPMTYDTKHQQVMALQNACSEESFLLDAFGKSFGSYTITKTVATLPVLNKRLAR